MRRIIVASMIAVLICTLCACSKNTIEYNDDQTEIYYKGHTYYHDDKLDGIYEVDYESIEHVKIGELMTSDLYANNAENPDYIYVSPGAAVYFREDTIPDFNALLTLREKETFEFTIPEVTTGETAQYTTYDRADYRLRLKFEATVEPYTAIYQTFEVYEKSGKYYLLNYQGLQECEYYEITKEFYEKISAALQK